MASIVEAELKNQIPMFNHMNNFSVTLVDKIAAAKRTAFYFETRLKLLDEYKSSFFNRNEVLESFHDDAKFKYEEYLKNDLYSEAEMLNVSHRATLMSEWERLKIPTSTGDATTSGQAIVTENVLLAQSLSHSVRKVNVPKFSGEQRDWEHFKEMFDAVIINDHRITPIVKLERLINNCDGKAKQVLKGVRITSANFQLTWNKLLRRYDGQKRRLHTHLQSLLDLPQVKSDLASDISTLIDRAEEAVKGLEGLKCPIAHYNNFFVYTIVRKLDTETRDSWNLHEKKKEEFSEYRDLSNFLENSVASSMDTPEELKPEVCADPFFNKNSDKTIKAHLANDSTQPSKEACIFCSGTNHKAYGCSQFLKLTANKRIDFLNKNKRCLNCLTPGHNSSKFDSKMRCLEGGCGLKHNSLVHVDGKQSTQCQKTIVDYSSNADHVNPFTVDVSGEKQVTQAHCSFSTQAVLLATAQIFLKDDHGVGIMVNTLIDHGSMRSFVSKRVLSALNLVSLPTEVTVKGIGNSELASPSEFCRLSISSRTNRNLNLSFHALILGQ